MLEIIFFDISSPLTSVELISFTNSFSFKFIILVSKLVIFVLPKGTVMDFVPLLLRFSLANFSLDGISSVDWSIISKPNFLMILAKNLENSHESARIKIIEKNKERAEFLASELNNTIVINGDALDEEVLVEANLQEAETVLALTNDDEDNLSLIHISEPTRPY